MSMIYDRFQVSTVSDQYESLGDRSESAGSRLAGVAVAASNHWQLSQDDQLNMVICHSGQ